MASALLALLRVRHCPVCGGVVPRDDSWSTNDCACPRCDACDELLEPSERTTCLECKAYGEDDGG